jgi:hypothetical protein
VLGALFTPLAEFHVFQLSFHLFLILGGVVVGTLADLALEF